MAEDLPTLDQTPHLRENTGGQALSATQIVTRSTIPDLSRVPFLKAC